MEMVKIGITITGFNIESFSYPESVRKMQERAASESMMGDMNKHMQMAMTENMAKGNTTSSTANAMAGMQMGMMMGQQMTNAMQTAMNNISSGQQQAQSGNGSVPNFCPNCGSKTNGANFCSNCGTKLV